MTTTSPDRVPDGAVPRGRARSECAPAPVRHLPARPRPAGPAAAPAPQLRRADIAAGWLPARPRRPRFPPDRPVRPCGRGSRTGPTQVHASGRPVRPGLARGLSCRVTARGARGAGTQSAPRHATGWPTCSQRPLLPRRAPRACRSSWDVRRMPRARAHRAVRSGQDRLHRRTWAAAVPRPVCPAGCSAPRPAPCTAVRPTLGPTLPASSSDAGRAAGTTAGGAARPRPERPRPALPEARQRPTSSGGPARRLRAARPPVLPAGLVVHQVPAAGLVWRSPADGSARCRLLTPGRRSAGPVPAGLVAVRGG